MWRESKGIMIFLIACEESQAVCKELRALGHESYSCDLQECSGGHPEWHFRCDVKHVIHAGYLITQSGDKVFISKWDRVIFFPECKHLCWSGERWFVNGSKPMILRYEAFEFFKWCYHYAYEKLNIPVAIENSLSLFLERNGYPPDQKVHPFHFGSPFRKTTCIWVRGLKPLMPTGITFKREPAVHNMWPTKDKNERSKLRAKTDPMIARAMAEQWGGKIECGEKRLSS